MAQEPLPRAYESADVEKKWFPEWEKANCFHGDPKSSKPGYSIVIPPPNVTGILTLGHVLNNTLQDILCRRARMKGLGRQDVCPCNGKLIFLTERDLLLGVKLLGNIMQKRCRPHF